MKRLLVLFMLSIVTCANAQSSLTLSEAKEIANTFYGSLQQIAKHPYGDIRIANERRLFGVMGVDENGNTIAGRGEVPNDLVGLEGKQVEDNRPIQIRSYITRFLRIAEEKKMDFSYKVLSNDYQYGPEIKKTDETPLFVRVVVQKTIKSSSFPMTQINDTMLINTRNRAIWITNKYRKSSGSNYENKTIDELLAEAQSMYSNRRYDEAYKLYQKALEKDPTNAEVSYSLGVMSFKGEGCKQYPRKVRDYLVDFYWQKSNKGVEQLILNYNTINVKYTGFSGWESDPFPSNRLLAGNPKKKRIGFISKQGKMVIKQQYKYAYPFFTNGTAIVKSDKNEWFLIDTMGKVKDVYAFCYMKDSHPLFGKHGKYLFVENNNGKKGLINRITGQWWLPCAYDVKQYVFFDGDLAYCIVNKEEKSGVCAEGGKMILPFGTYRSIYVVCRTAEKVRILCDYDEKELMRLLEKYQKGSLIPYEDMDRIGTLFTININQ